MAWSYALWREQSTPSAQLTMLRQHMGEVAAEIGADVGIEGKNRSHGSLVTYMTGLQADEKRLIGLVGESVSSTSPRLVAGFTRGRAI